MYILTIEENILKPEPGNGLVKRKIMIQTKEALPQFLSEPTQIGEEISITGKWIPVKKGGLFKKSKESKEAKAHDGMLSTEINHLIGQDAVLIHHVFKNTDSLIKYFSNTATNHAEALGKVAKPDIHLVKGLHISDAVKDALVSKNVPASFGEYLFGFVRNDYQRPDPKNAIQVTAKWTCESDEDLDELIYWWQKVGTDAFDLEKGLVRYEAYRVIREHSLIIHETFEDSDELKFHLSKGTAAIYKKELDKISAPANYFFRGPVSWTIRAYSKFLKLPATYSSQGSHFSHAGGNMTDGTY